MLILSFSAIWGYSTTVGEKKNESLIVPSNQYWILKCKERTFKAHFKIIDFCLRDQEREKKQTSDRQGVTSNLLFYSPNACNNQRWAVVKPGAWNAPRAWSTPWCLPGSWSEEQSWDSNSSVLAMGVGIPRGISTNTADTHFTFLFILAWNLISIKIF